MKKKVYIVEDQPAVAQLMMSMLATRPDVETLWMKSGLDAYLRVQDERPHLIVADILLPGLNGLALTRLLKFHDDFCDIPMLVVSSVTDPSIRQIALDAGADDFLSKPFDVEAFHAHVARLLERRILA